MIAQLLLQLPGQQSDVYGPVVLKNVLFQTEAQIQLVQRLRHTFKRGFADYRGNRQHVSTANLIADPRVSLFLMDYPNRRRLKLLGHARIVTAAQDPALVAALMPQGYKALAERAYVIEVTGFDWNCPQHITPRFTETEIARAIQPLHTEIDRLRAELTMLRGTPEGE